MVVAIFDAVVIVTSVEAVDTLLSVVGTEDTCDESTAVEEDKDSAGSFVTCDVVCGSSVVEPIFSAVEDDGELLTEVRTVIFVSVPVTDFTVVIFDSDVMVTFVVAIDSLFSVVGTEDVCDESTAVEEDKDSDGPFVTSDVVCGLSVVELILCAVEIGGELLNEVLTVLIP